MTAWMNNSAFGNDWQPAYNAGEHDDGREPFRGGKMRKTVTTIRCVPRYGYEHAQVRTVDLELYDAADENEMRSALELWFAQRGIGDAVFDIAVDDDGFFAVINDEAYFDSWGEVIF